MIFQVRANLFFDIQDEAVDFYRDCVLACPKSVSLNSDLPSVEHGTIELIHNNHDTDPNEPCIVVQSQTTEPQ